MIGGILLIGLSFASYLACRYASMVRRRDALLASVLGLHVSEIASLSAVPKEVRMRRISSAAEEESADDHPYAKEMVDPTDDAEFSPWCDRFDRDLQNINLSPRCDVIDPDLRNVNVDWERYERVREQLDRELLFFKPRFLPLPKDTYPETHF
jgi:hypothetical protein